MRASLRSLSLGRITTEYNALIASKLIFEDSNQRKTISLLESLSDALNAYTPTIFASTKTKKKITSNHNICSLPDSTQNESETRQDLMSLFRTKPTNGEPPKITEKQLSNVPKGIYMYGGVGSGKTMLMDLFYSTAMTKSKKRYHFNEFMLMIHSKSHAIKNLKEKSNLSPIAQIAESIVKSSHLICLDELQVVDIADAMILRSLFTHFAALGAIFVITANKAPDSLYVGGIQRKEFMPAIDILKQRCKVHALGAKGSLDYRKVERESAGVYFDTREPDTNMKIGKIFTKLSCVGSPVSPTTLDYLGRNMVYTTTNTCILNPQKKVLLCTFKDLCGKPLSSKDFIELAKTFKIFIIENIPDLANYKDRNEARRFVLFIDTIYDAKSVVIASYNVDFSTFLTIQSSDGSAVDEIMRDEIGIKDLVFREDEFAFKRAKSRLVEMGSRKWVGEIVADAVAEELKPRL